MENVTTELLARLLDIDKDGFRVVSLITTDSDDGERGEVWVQVETTATPVGCPACGVRAASKDRRKAMLRDLEIAGRPAVIVWNKRVWCCEEPACPTKTWTEQATLARPRMSMTERARSDAARRIGDDTDSVAC